MVKRTKHKPPVLAAGICNNSPADLLERNIQLRAGIFKRFAEKQNIILPNFLQW